MFYQIVAVTENEEKEALYAEFLVKADTALDAIVKFNEEPQETEAKVVSVSPTNISEVIT